MYKIPPGGVLLAAYVLMVFAMISAQYPNCHLFSIYVLVNEGRFPGLNRVLSLAQHNTVPLVRLELHRGLYFIIFTFMTFQDEYLPKFDNVLM